jgi:hypothetical protein
MSSTYEIIDLISGNVIRAYGSEVEALAALRALLDQAGSDALADYSLMKVIDGDQTVVAMEGDLLRLVEQPSAADVVVTPGAPSPSR